MTGKAFKLNMHPNTYFDSNPFKSTEPRKAASAPELEVRIFTGLVFQQVTPLGHYFQCEAFRKKNKKSECI